MKSARRKLMGNRLGGCGFGARNIKGGISFSRIAMVLVFVLLAIQFAFSALFCNFDSSGKDVWDEKSATLQDNFGRYSSQSWTSRFCAVLNGYRRPYGKCPRLRVIPQVNITGKIQRSNMMDNLRYTCTCLTNATSADNQNSAESCSGGEMRYVVDNVCQEKRSLQETTLLLTDTKTLLQIGLTNPVLLRKILVVLEGKNYLSAIYGADAISGEEPYPLETRHRFASKLGCDYNSLRMELPHFDISYPTDCRRFLKFTREYPGKTWTIASFPADSENIKNINGTVLDPERLCQVNHFRASGGRARNIMVRQVLDHPLLAFDTGFEIEVFFLIASTMPYYVFFSTGFTSRKVQRLNSVQSREMQILIHLQEYLIGKGIAGPHFISSSVLPMIKKSLALIFMSARKHLVRRKGSFHLFKMKYTLDEDLRLHFILATDFLTSSHSSQVSAIGLVKETLDLVTALHERPHSFQEMVRGENVGIFELIYSEIQSGCMDSRYDPCGEFSQYNRGNARQAAKLINKLHKTKKWNAGALSEKTRRPYKLRKKRSRQPCINDENNPATQNCSYLSNGQRIKNVNARSSK